MKKIKLFLLLLMLTGASAYSQLQQIKIVSFTVKNQLPPVIDNWSNIPGSLLLVAQLPPNVSVKGIRLMVQIKGGGSIICSNNSAGGMQVDEFTTRTFSANELTSTLQGCHDLKEGSYSICVQFYNIDRVSISNEVCKEFSVESPRDIEYTPPTLISPVNDKIFSESELSKPVTFRWTPLVPKPRDPVTYRLKVWQLMQGQNSTEAMRTNQPIVNKDVDNITQAVVNGIYTGPCRPPYLCDYVWQVQALNREGKPIGKNEGRSEPYTFKVEMNTTTSTAPQLISPNDGKAFAPNEMAAPVFFRWTPVVPKPQSVIYRLKVWQLMQGQSASQAMRTNQPIVTKDVDNITQAAITGIYTGPCRPPYLCDYVWQVQAVDREDHPVGNNEGKSELWSFKVGDNVTTCSAPKLSEPVGGKSFVPKDASNAITFRWTPVVPKPQEPVTYRLKVWQLMQGQSGSQAMRTNKPIVTKDVADITEASVSGIYTGPCRPPYLCDYIWEVQALNREGKPICSNEGKSEAFTFKVEENASTECIPPKLQSPADAKSFAPKDASAGITFRWTPLVPKPATAVSYRLKVWQLMQGQNGSQAMRTNKPIVTKDVADITEATVSGIYTGPCRPPYLCDFIWAVETMDATGRTSCTSEGTSFSVKKESQQQCPVNTFPENNKAFSQDEAKQPFQFRWTPIVPKPQEPVTYRLKVWQLMQGQNGTAAMRTNKPIVTKDVADITEATVSGIYTGPCRPPYLCDFIWSVQALDRTGKPVCDNNNGTSEPTAFTISPCSPDYELKWDSVACGDDGKVHVLGHIVITPKPGITINSVLLTAIKENNFLGLNVPTTLTLPTTLTASGNIYPFSFIVNQEMCNKKLFLAYTINSFCASTGITSPTYCADSIAMPCCTCTFCDQYKQWTFSSQTVTATTTTPYTVSVSTTISAPAITIKSFKAELISFIHNGKEECFGCNKDAQTFGNFTGGTFGSWGSGVFPLYGTNTTHHTLTWFSATPGGTTNLAGSAINLTFTAPPLSPMSCCDDEIKFCIRYSFTDKECRTCSFVKCYGPLTRKH